MLHARVLVRWALIVSLEMYDETEAQSVGEFSRGHEPGELDSASRM